MMTEQKQKTLKQLIEEVMEEFETRNKEFLNNHGLVRMEPDLGAVAGWKLGFIECKEWNKDFFRQSLIKISKATAEAGELELKKLKDRIYDPVLEFDEFADFTFSRGYNQAIKDQQQKLKEFMGEYYDQD